MNALNQNYELYGAEEGVEKFLKEKTSDDKSMFLTKDEFVNIEFDLEWPLIIKDLAKYLTSLDLLKGSRISEADELYNLKMDVEYFKDSDLAPYRGHKLTLNQYTLLINSFRAFQGMEEKAKTKKDLEYWLQYMPNYSENNLFLEEKDFVNNFERVFGHDCKYFGKLLYLYMADGYDRKKIHFLKFVECLFPLFD
jgi:hypothetical protein